jgi:hypothetical protein
MLRFRPLVAVALLALPTPGAAQVVRGVVVDDTNLSPVSAAMVRLVVGEELATGRETDGQGRFRLPVPTAGEYRLEVSRLGYETTRSQPFRVEMGDTVSVEFRILPDAVLMAPLTVTARSRRGRDAFERRRSEWGRGVFLDRMRIDSIAPRHPADVLKGIEDLDLRWEWGANAIGSVGVLPTLRSVRGRGCMLYMVDWVPVRAEREMVPNDWAGYQLGMLEERDLVAVEVYRSVLEVPAELQRYTYTLSPTGGPGLVHCGLVLFWTRQGW